MTATTLSKKQMTFTKNVGKLIAWAYENGYGLTFGDAYRDQRLADLNAAEGKGISKSLHTQRLAVDFNLFMAGNYIPQSEMYKPLGDYWKTLDPENRWGGDFKPRPDGNHFSMMHAGIK
jgi:hypothetical protein